MNAFFQACAPAIGVCATLPGVSDALNHMFLQPSVDAPVQALVRGTSDPDVTHGTHIPRVIWTYWNDAELPEFVSRNLQRWQEVLSPEFDIVLVTDQTLGKYILSPNDVPPMLRTQYSKQHQADWIRLYLLKHHGGIWADSGILFNSKAALIEMHDRAVREHVELAGFYLECMQTSPHCPVVENWFFMVPAPTENSSAVATPPSLIERWFDEYDCAVRIGFPAYRTYAEQQLGVDPQRIFVDSPTYLTCHLCLQTVMQVKMPTAKLYLLRAEDTMLKVHRAAGWNLAMIWLLLYQPASRRIPFIKLRGGDRMGIDVQRLFSA